MFGLEASCRSIFHFLKAFSNKLNSRLVAQLITPSLVVPSETEEDLLLSLYPSHYASLTWLDLWAIAPWMVDKITKCIDGWAGLFEP